MKRRFVNLLLVLVMLLSFVPNTAKAEEPIKLWINGSYVATDVSPVIDNNRTLVPIRVISENLGYEVDWNESSRIALIKKRNSKTEIIEKYIGISIDNPLLYNFSVEKFYELLHRDLDGENVTQEEFTQFALDAEKIQMDASPKILNNRTMVPIRVIAEQFNQQVDWDPETRTVIVGGGYDASKTQAESSNNTFIEAVVTNVVDGDTIDVKINGKTHRVRLIGVDTPETKHPKKGVEYFGKEASAYTRSQLLNKTVYLEKDVSETDKYGRLLFYVWLSRPSTNNPTQEEISTKCFNSILVENGYAHVVSYPPDVKHVDFFHSRQRIARSNSYGLWGNGGQAPTTIATNQEKIVLNPSIGQEYIADTSQGVIKGNKKSKIYHVPGGRSYNRISVKNVVYFQTEAQAIAAGYRKAQNR